MASEKLFADYIEHLTGIEMRKDKRWTDKDRKRAETKKQKYMYNDWLGRSLSQKPVVIP